MKSKIAVYLCVARIIVIQSVQPVVKLHLFILYRSPNVVYLLLIANINDSIFYVDNSFLEKNFFLESSSNKVLHKM